MTFSDLLAGLYRDLNYKSSPASDTVTRLKAYVNEIQQALASEPGLSALLRGSMTFATEADRAEYGLPASVARVITVRETTNDRRLVRASLDDYRWNVPDASTWTGTPDRYVMLELKAVQRQPSDASSLFAKSTNAADTQTLHYEIRQTDGTVVTASVVLTGTTAVNLSSTLTTIEEVNDLYLSAVANGSVTLHEDNGTGTQLALIGRGRTRSINPWIAFWPTPSAAITYTLDYERDATDLVQDNDEPAWLPPRFHRLLAQGARMREYEKTDDSRLTVAREEYLRSLSRLKAYLQAGDEIPVMGGRGRVAFSRLGANYPADTWS